MPHNKGRFKGNFILKGDTSMRKICCTVLLLAALVFAGVVLADENFGVKPPILNPTTEAPIPTITAERTADGYVHVGPDGTLVPAPVRGFEPGNGKDTSFGVGNPPPMPKAN
jgi:hypothetical protein